MSKSGKVFRWIAAIGLVLGPFMILVLPEIFKAADYQSAEEQFRAIATQPTGTEYTWLLIQALGAVMLVPAAVGLAGQLARRSRGVVMGIIGASLWLISAVFVLPAIGVELAQFFVLMHGADKNAMVQLALSLNTWPLFSIFLLGFLTAMPLGLLFLGLGSARARLIPWWALTLFLLPVFGSFLTLPGSISNALLAIGLGAVPFWIAMAMVRQMDVYSTGQVSPTDGTITLVSTQPGLPEKGQPDMPR